MEHVKVMHASWNVPNIINICVDEVSEGELSGRLYHCYSKTAWKFSNIVRLVEYAEELFDHIEFPEAATQTRTFMKKNGEQKEKWKHVTSTEQIEKQRGIRDTFLLQVQYRQNTTWQGSVVWVEGHKTWEFLSVLELFKIITHVVEE